MPARRGVARISAPRRRTFRVKVKWDPEVIGRRFKRLLPIMTPELNWEIEILELLEQDVYPYLQAQGVSTDLWEYYVDFAKRMWERRVHFLFETFLLEKASLVNEFTWRGLDPTHLSVIQGYAEEKALAKLRLARFMFYEPWGEEYEEPPDMVAIFSEPWTT